MDKLRKKGDGVDRTFAAFSPAVTACAFTVSPLTATPAYAARFSSSEDVASLLIVTKSSHAYLYIRCDRAPKCRQELEAQPGLGRSGFE